MGYLVSAQFPVQTVIYHVSYSFHRLWIEWKCFWPFLQLVTFEARSNVDLPDLYFELVKGQTQQTNSDETFRILEFNNSVAIVLAKPLDYETVPLVPDLGSRPTSLGTIFLKESTLMGRLFCIATGRRDPPWGHDPPVWEPSPEMGVVTHHFGNSLETKNGRSSTCGFPPFWSVTVKRSPLGLRPTSLGTLFFKDGTVVLHHNRKEGPSLGSRPTS